MRQVLTPRFLLAAAVAAVVAGVLGAMSWTAVVGAPARAADDDVAALVEGRAGVEPTDDPMDDRTGAVAVVDRVEPRDGPARPARRALPARAHPLAALQLQTSTSPEGWTVAGGSSADPVDRGGRTVRWTLEVEPATGLDVAEVLATAEAALYDERSWARDHELVRVDDPADASVRVLVGTGGTVDALCARAGLVTNGIFSCWNGRVAALTLVRWTGGTSEIGDLALYRRYLVNHEVGHGLGHGHRGCPGAGRLAPVMQQQTRTLAGCVANPWPYPD